MKNFIINKSGEKVEYPPYQCKVCGLYEIKYWHEVCGICGWEDDRIQQKNHDYEGGANILSLNQYQAVWGKNKERLMVAEGSGLAMIELVNKEIDKRGK